MKLERKTIIYLVIFAMFLFAFFMALFSQCRAKKQPENNISSLNHNRNTQITNFTDITKRKIFFPGLNTKKSIIYLGNFGIEFYEFNITSMEINQIYPSIVTSTQNVVYSPDGSKAIVKFDSGENFLFDFVSKKSSALDKNIGSIDFTSDSQKIIYTYYRQDLDYQTINIANPDGSDWQEIANFKDSNIFYPSLDIAPDNKYVVLFPEPEGYGANYIYTLDISTKEIKKITDDGYAAAPKLSPNGEKIIYQVVDSKTFKPTLWVMNKDGSSKKDTKITAFTDKLTWMDDNNIIIALDPNLPDDYLSDLVYESNDKYIIYNTENNSLTGLNTDQTLTNVKNLMYAGDNILLFTGNDFLYKMEIK